MTFSDESDTTVIEFKGELIYSLHVLCVCPKGLWKMVCVSVCVHVCMCACLFVRPSACLSIHLFVCSSERQTWESMCAFLVKNNS